MFGGFVWVLRVILGGFWGTIQKVFNTVVEAVWEVFKGISGDLFGCFFVR